LNRAAQEVEVARVYIFGVLRERGKLAVEEVGELFPVPPHFLLEKEHIFDVLYCPAQHFKAHGRDGGFSSEGGSAVQQRLMRGAQPVFRSADCFANAPAIRARQEIAQCRSFRAREHTADRHEGSLQPELFAGEFRAPPQFFPRVGVCIGDGQEREQA